MQVVLVVLALLFLLPFVSMLSSSVRNDAYRVAHPGEILPRAEYVRRPKGEWREVLRTEERAAQGRPGELRARVGNWSASVDKVVTVQASDLQTRVGPTVRPYFQGLLAGGFARFSLVTLVLCVVSVAAVTFTSALVAYSFSILRWPGRDTVFYVALATLLLPVPLTMPSLFQLYRGAGLVQTYVPLVLPSFFGNAFFIFLLRQFFLKVPADLIDAARLEGGTEWQVFTRTVLPLSVPALSVVALLGFVFQWGMLLEPLVCLSGSARETVSLGLAQMQSKFPGHAGELMAMCLVTTLPVVIVLLLAWKPVLRGVRAMLPARLSR